MGQKFQPTRPHGARRRSVRSCYLREAVSTHAPPPARGATSAALRRTSSPPMFHLTRPPGATGGATHLRPWFNPRAREGRDILASSSRKKASQFQPTRPRRARPTTVGEATRSLDQFQPTRPRMARRASNRLSVAPVVFQPTRPRRARHARRPEHRGQRDVLTHAPAKGATVLSYGTDPGPASVSTHAPAKGATGVETHVNV